MSRTARRRYNVVLRMYGSAFVDAADRSSDERTDSRMEQRESEEKSGDRIYFLNAGGWVEVAVMTSH